MQKSENQFQFQHYLEVTFLFLVIAFVLLFVFTIVDVLDIVKSSAYSSIASSLSL